MFSNFRSSFSRRHLSFCSRLPFSSPTRSEAVGRESKEGSAGEDAVVAAERSVDVVVAPALRAAAQVLGEALLGEPRRGSKSGDEDEAQSGAEPPGNGEEAEAGKCAGPPSNGEEAKAPSGAGPPQPRTDRELGRNRAPRDPREDDQSKNAGLPHCEPGRGGGVPWQEPGQAATAGGCSDSNAEPRAPGRRGGSASPGRSVASPTESARVDVERDMPAVAAKPTFGEDEAAAAWR